MQKGNAHCEPLNKYYCLLLITKELPTKEEIGRIMRPYDTENPDRYDVTVEMPPLWFSFDGYYIGGIYHDRMRHKDGSCVSCAKVSDLSNFNEVECHFCIDENGGNAIGLESDDEKDIRAFETELAKIKANSRDCYATMIDIHS